MSKFRSQVQIMTRFTSSTVFELSGMTSSVRRDVTVTVTLIPHPGPVNLKFSYSDACPDCRAGLPTPHKLLNASSVHFGINVSPDRDRDRDRDRDAGELELHGEHEFVVHSMVF